MTNFVVDDQEHTPEELFSALRGEYGPEGQEWGEVVAAGLEEQGYFGDELEGAEDEQLQYEPEDEGPTPEDEHEAMVFAKEAQRLEGRIGRKLTPGEMQYMVNDVAAQNGVPNLVDKYAPSFEARDANPIDRRELMVEEIEAREAAREASETEAEENHEPDAFDAKLAGATARAEVRAAMAADFEANEETAAEDDANKDAAFQTAFEASQAAA